MPNGAKAGGFSPENDKFGKNCGKNKKVSEKNPGMRFTFFVMCIKILSNVIGTSR